MRVGELDATGQEFVFIVDCQDVEAIKECLPQRFRAYDSYFAAIADGDYQTVYGMQGTVPLLTNHLTLCRGKDGDKAESKR